MEDEEFEKYFERIYKAFQWLHNDKVKSELKRILEEIYNQGCSDGIDSIVNYEKGRG